MTAIGYPRNIKKYTGSIEEIGGGFRLYIKYKGQYLDEWYEKKEEAEGQMKFLNISMGMPILNLMIKKDGYLEVEASGKTFLIDVEDRDFVDKHVWYINGKMQVITPIDGKNKYLVKMLRDLHEGKKTRGKDNAKNDYRMNKLGCS
jgi:hypothetical protein